VFNIISVRHQNMEKTDAQQTLMCGLVFFAIERCTSVLENVCNNSKNVKSHVFLI